VKPLAQIAKQLAARLAFLISLMVLLPLAVLNRQNVGVSLNPMDLLRDTPQTPLVMPLFIALFASFIFGLLAGWVMGRFGKNGAKRAMPRRSGVIKPPQDKPAKPAKPSKPAKRDDAPAPRRLGSSAMAAPPEEAGEKSREKSGEKAEKQADEEPEESDEQDEK
jgi:hypothetical protein